MKQQNLTIPEQKDGQRLDQVLASLLADITRSQAARLIKEGNVKIDGKPAKSSTTVATGQQLDVVLPDPQPIDLEPQAIELDVVFEDDHMLVINKAAGMVVHPAPGNRDRTLVNALLHRYPALRQVGLEDRPGIVHRLDKGTSGLIVVAKTYQALIALQRLFAKREVDKQYLAIVVGKPRQAKGRIEMAIGRHVRDRKKISSVTTKGRAATTLYRVLASRGGISALNCTILSGRTHQVRVHCAESGWPLVGDSTYGGVRPLKRISNATLQTACRALSRPALHAWRLSFIHPTTGEETSFEAPIPDDLQSILALLEEKKDD